MLEILAKLPFLFFSLIAILGLIIGSFLNVIIYRLPVMLHRQWHQDCEQYLYEHKKEPHSPPRVESDVKTAFNLIRPASHCPHCEYKLKVWENIPLISFLWLKGRCQACQQKISWRYPLIELFTALLSVAVAVHYDLTWACLGALLLTWALIALAAIDFEQQILPDEITFPLLWLGLVFNLQGTFVALPSAVIGAIGGYLFLWSIYWLFKILTHKEGIGRGDFKLLAMLGAWLGWQALPMIILLSSLAGVLIGVSLILTKRLERSTPIPFGPFLAIAGWVSLIWGKQLSSFYLSFI